MALGALAILDAVVSHALASGLFDACNKHEPKAAPRSGLTAAVWVESVTPRPTASGLAATTARVALNLRLYSNMLSEPQDAIDPAMVDAVDQLMTAYSGDFTLGGIVRDVDLLGAHGVPLSAQAGYLSQDNKMYRVMTITLPVIVNDAWVQAP